FIVEYVAQTRGWFYTLMVLGTMLFDQPPFLNAMCHGVVLDENRQKLSKRLRNYPDPLEFFDAYGSDTMRWFLVSSAVLSGGDLVIPKEARELAQVQREAISPLLNSYAFFSLYANLEDFEPTLVTGAEHELDHYILTKLADASDGVGAALAQYDIPGAARWFGDFMELLTNWYIRRSRDRFWEEDDTASKRAAFDTLYTVLVHACQIGAPLLPIVTEKLYRNLTGERSVHLSNWPAGAAFDRDADLAHRMDLVRGACSAGLAVRDRQRLRVRLPLKKAVVVHPSAPSLERHAAMISSELNIRSIEFSDDLEAFGSVELRVDPKIGRRLGKKMREVMAAAKAGDYEMLDDGGVRVAGEDLADNEFELRMICDDGGDTEPFGGTGAIVVDTSVDADQEQEGTARDLIRAVQNARKDAGFHVADRIALGIDASPTVLESAEKFADLIASQTLATTFTLSLSEGEVSEHDLRGEKVRLSMAPEAVTN
ncbi:MAG: DUF5915 domain-containing protein, partial [Alphaproteobacteria bacterium]